MPTITLDCTEITKAHATTDPPIQALHGVDLQVPEGEFLVIMGVLGSDKLTLLYNISSMDQSTAGIVRLKGRELIGLSGKEMSRVRLTHMGFVFQWVYFPSNLTIRDNMLLLALKADPRGASEMVSRVDALFDRFDVGYVKQHGIMKVSGGQLQYASICQTLAGEPAVVFVNESIGVLNNSMTAEVMDVLFGAHAERRTIVMATHDLTRTTRADRVVYPRDGRLVDSRSMECWCPEQTTQRENDLLA